VLPSPSGKFVFAAESPSGNSILSSYSIGAGGKFALNNSVSPTAGSQFRGFAANPKQRVIYVAVKDTNLIEVLTYNTAGLMAYADTVADPGQGVTWLTTDPAGTRLFASEPGSNTVTSYDISGGNILSPVQVSSVTLKTGGSPTQLRTNAAGNFLFVLGLDETGRGGSFLHVLAVDSSGDLTETGNPVQIPVANGEIPQGVVVVR
jgi:6-phosphogluconolactonase (cycloisomerase 2 family)